MIDYKMKNTQVFDNDYIWEDEIHSIDFICFYTL